MNRYLASAFALCLAAAAPTALYAQGQPQGGQHGSPSTPHTTISRPSTVGTHITTHHTTITTHHTTVTTRPVHHVTTYHRHVTTPATHVVVRPLERSHVKVDITTYRRNVTAERRFHYGEYRAPRGYEYRRWSYGERLPAIYFGRNFWIANYINFGLPYAPDGYVWVRFGPDAILIDESTGEIIEVEYDVFY
jgi:Ni/Co efflux regulator RcnB